MKPCDFEDVALKTYIGRVDGLEDFSLGNGLERFDCRNNRLAWLGLQQDGFMVAVAEAKQRYGAHRIAVIMGTSTSGILDTEHAYRQRDPRTGSLPALVYLAVSLHAQYVFAGTLCAGLSGCCADPRSVISTACSSSAKVFATAARLLAAGLCDAAIVGGVDSLCLTTLYGFSALQLLSTSPAVPATKIATDYRSAKPRDLHCWNPVSAWDGGARSRCWGTAKARMATICPIRIRKAPARSRRFANALARAGLEPADIDYINLHGTATRANDAVEDKAVYGIFGAHTALQFDEGLDRTYARSSRDHGGADFGDLPDSRDFCPARSTANGWIRSASHILRRARACDRFDGS